MQVTVEAKNANRGPHSYPAGRFELRLELRSSGTDGGVALSLYGPLSGERLELLRFDCFRCRPHYHVGLSHRSVRIDPIDADDTLEWAVTALRRRLGDLLAELGAETPAASEHAQLGAAIDRAHAQALAWRAEA